MTKKKSQRLFMRNSCFVMFMAFGLSLFAGSLAFAGDYPTVADPKGIKTEFPQQLELDKYEKQTGKKLTFNENPLFAEKVKKGELSPVEKRLPAEPLVVMPYDEIGKSGGKLRGICIAYESGTSEVMAWRQANMVRFSDDLRTIVPNVAKAWKWSSDYKEITFELRKGHRWSDGSPFTADDVVFYINDIILNKEIHKVTPAPWGALDVKVEKIDEVTVKFKFKKPYTGLLYYFGGGGSYFVPWAPKDFLKQYHIKYNLKASEEAKKNGFDNWVQQFGTYWNKWKDAIVSGPNGMKVPTLESHIMKEEINTQRRILIANPYYFKIDTAGNQLPYINIHHERFLEKQLWPLEIMNGNVDQKAQNMPLDIFPTLKENEAKGNYTLQLPSGMIGPAFIFNMTDKDPALRKVYADVRFRYAMSLAINRDEVNQALFLGLGTPEQALPQNVPYVTEEDKKFMTAYDPKRANELLDEMGLKRGKDGIRLRSDGKPLTVLWEYTLQYVWSPEFPALIADYWRSVGVNVLLKEVNTQLTRDKQKSNTLDITSEWLAVYESQMISSPQLFVPPYSSFWPIMGLPWMDWKTSGGKSGEEPPDWVKRLWEIADEWVTLVPGSTRYMELGKELIKINQENLVVIGTLGKIPLITVVSNRLGNTPKWKINSSSYGYAYPYRADQWYFK
ncbi:MAG: ABC transporter substrate-binding protein [Desulfobacteraceae bacterium]|nr:ABC transporter substrate-binding protein [Desulfobacteraceae bacterium]